METLSKQVIDTATQVVNSPEVKNRLVTRSINKFQGSYNKIKSHLSQQAEKAQSQREKYMKALDHIEQLRKDNKLKRVRSDSERKAMFASMRARKSY